MPEAALQAALRLTNHQREGVLAAYAALSSQLNAAQQAFLTAERRATNSSPPVVGGSGANVVGHPLPKLCGHRRRPLAYR